MQQERRKQVFTSPSFDNRVFRKGTIKGYSQNQRKDLDTSDPMQAAQAMRNMGMKMGEDGSLMPTQNWGGLMGKASQQLNALSRGAQAGEGSGLGGPAGTMYDRAPGFYNRAPSGLARGDYGTGAEGFGQMLAQTREQRVAQSQQDGTFGTIRDKYNLDNAGKGMQMNEFGNLVKSAGAVQTPYRPGLTGPTVQSQKEAQGQNLSRLQDAVTAKKLLAEASGEPKVTIPTITTPAGETPQIGAKNINGKYGSGFATTTKGPREEGKIGGRPFSEVMQGLANKPGIAREGDKFQPQNWSESLKKAKKK